jgi:putative membrane protein
MEHVAEGLAIMSGRPQDRNPWKGLAAGMVAGLIGAWIMGQFHVLVTKLPGMPVESAKEEDSTVKTAAAISEGLFHHALPEEEKKVAGAAVHYGFGAGVGGVYGAVAEILPRVTKGGGVPFGTAVWLGAHVIMVPALGLSRPATQSPLPKEVAELAAHFVYGAVTELIRRLIRTRVIRGG